jgi:hypothetical protein
MNIKDPKFQFLIKYTDTGRGLFSPEHVAHYFAVILADIVKRKVVAVRQTLWNEVPEIGADAKWGDIVKDYSIRSPRIAGSPESSDGQVGVVTEVREIRKRDGRTAVQVEIVFYNHTSPTYPRKRKLEFIKG